MDRRVVTGGLTMAISLTLVGAAVNAGEIPDAEPATSVAAEAPPTARAPQARAQVPIRSATPDLAETSSSRPKRVRIARIGLDADVLPVGVDEEQQFDVPAAESVGWYKFGAAPGDGGSTVLAAHVDFGGDRGAFFNLADLEQGDALEVELEDGSTMHYLVVDNVLYDKTDLPADELFRRGGESVLQLITCGGTFDPARRTYRGNVVVTAVPVQT